MNYLEDYVFLPDHDDYEGDQIVIGIISMAFIDKVAPPEIHLKGKRYKRVYNNLLECSSSDYNNSVAFIQKYRTKD